MAAHTDYYDKNDKLVTKYSFASKKCEYDKTGRKTVDRYFDAKGNEPSGYFSHIVYSYDDYGHIIGMECYGKNDTPMETRTTSGLNAHKFEITRDLRGNIIKKIVYDKTGSMVEHVCYSYDDNGREILEEYLNSSNENIMNENGYSIKKMEYNSLGNQLKEAYFDVNGELCKMSMGYASCIQKYDISGSLTDTFYYNEKGKPVNLIRGYSHIHEDFNEHRNTINCEFMDKNNETILSYKAEYNENAQITKESLYGPDGQLYMQPDTGIAIRELGYDEMGNQTSERYYSDSGEPVLVYNEMAGWISEYDDKSLEIKRTYIGMDENPQMVSTGFAIVQFIYDEYGREIERKFFDEDGKKTNIKYGFASYTVQYDDLGNISSYKYFDKDGIETDVAGEVKKIELDLHNGDVDIFAERYNPERGEWEIGAIAKTIYNIYLIVYQDSKGEYDVMRQPYIPLSPKNYINEYIKDIKVRYKKVIGKEQGDKSFVEAEADVQAFMDQYVEIVETGATDRLWDIFLMDWASAAIKIIEEMLGVKKSKEELKKYYYDFYDRELISFRNQLNASYGNYVISYEIRDINEYTGEILNNIINTYEQYGIKNIDGMMALNVAFTVKGEDKENLVTDSFLYPNMNLVRVSGSWKLLTPDGFPKPSTDELKKFLGIEETVMRIFQDE